MEIEEDCKVSTGDGNCSLVSLSNPQLPVDLADQTDLLKGDAIGNTLYSERFVLKTLIKLSQIKIEDWSEDFENDLCFLWDMTVERDVVLLLMKHDFLKLSVSLLQGPVQEPRFIEIVVGILRNMSCVEDVRQVISERLEMTRLLMQLLSSSDTLTLIQLVRLLHSVAWDLVKQVDQRNCSTQKHWLEKEMDCQLLCEKLSFLLCSSTNGELLYGVLDILNTLCTCGPTLSDKDFSQYFSTTGMVSSLLECWQQLFNTPSTMDEDDIDVSEGNKVENELFLDKHMFKTASKWVTIVASFTGHEKGREALVSNGDQLSIIMSRIVSKPYDDELYEDMLADVVNVLEALIATHFVPDIIKQLLTIFHSVTQLNGEVGIPTRKLTLIDAFENFFESAVRDGSKSKLSEGLEMCDEHLIIIFWTVIKKRDQDLLDVWKSDVKPFDERSI